MTLMQGVQAYALVQATTRALYAQLLSPSDWTTLIQTPDYDDVLAFLNRTSYAEYLRLDRALLTPRRTTYQIRWHLADVYAKLIRTSPEPGGEVLRQLWHHYEVDNIRVALRGVVAGASWDRVLHLLYPMRKYISVDIDDLERMVRAPDVPRAVEVLRGTPYYNQLVHALLRYEEEQSLFPLEVALDLGYRRDLWAAIYELRGKDREMALKMVGTVLDTDNLLWAIRYRVYHNLSEAEIINYTLPMGYEVEDADIQAIARGADIARVIFKVYPQLREPLQDVSFRSGEGLERLEQELLVLMLERCRRVFVGAPFHLGLPLGYVLLGEYEIRDLTIIIEAKASQTPPEVFVPMLLMRGVMRDQSGGQ